MLSNELITELKEIIKQDYHEDLPVDQVSKIGSDLVKYGELLIKTYKQLPNYEQR